MSPTIHTAIRELDHRKAEGIEVRLLSDPQTNDVAVTVEDERRGEALAFTVDGAEALAAFHHPYAYASTTHIARRSTPLPDPERSTP